VCERLAQSRCPAVRSRQSVRRPIDEWRADKILVRYKDQMKMRGMLGADSLAASSPLSIAAAGTAAAARKH